MRWIRGSALFAAGMLVGIFIMTSAASPQKKPTGLHLNHFGINVRDLEESAKFYTEKMGFREVFRFKDAAGKPIVYVQLDHNTFLEMTPADKDNPVGFSHGGIVSDDLETTVATLKREGVKVEEVHLGATKALISNAFDPNGVRLELLSYPPESLQGKAISAWK
jgi:catechol 2,3-dioxygenase-like lactoylglutathione lyase family enzyme